MYQTQPLRIIYGRCIEYPRCPLLDQHTRRGEKRWRTSSGTIRRLREQHRLGDWTAHLATGRRYRIHQQKQGFVAV